MCSTCNDYLNAVLFYMAVQEIYISQNNKIYLANEISDHEILAGEGFWVALYTHLYRRQQHYLKMKINPDVKRLLTRESFYKNFELFKLKLNKQELFVSVFEKVCCDLKLGTFDEEAAIIKEAQNDLLSLWENYTVDPENMCLISLKTGEVEEILQQIVPSSREESPKKEESPQKNESPIKVDSPKKEESARKESQNDEEANKEEEFTPIKDQNESPENEENLVEETKDEPVEEVKEEHIEEIKEEPVEQDETKQEVVEIKEEETVEPQESKQVETVEKNAEKFEAPVIYQKSVAEDLFNPYRNKLFRLRKEFKNFILE